MSSVRKRLHGPAQLGTTAATKYTVPSGKLAIVRSIHVNVDDPASGDAFTLSIGTDGAGTRVFSGTPVSGYLHLEVFFVLDAGEIIQAFAQDANELNLTICGEEIQLG